MATQTITPTGIASTAAFGSPAHGISITPQSIDSTAIVPSPTVILATIATGSIYRIYVNGVLRNDYVLNRRKPISINHETGSFGTCRMTWYDPAGTTRPEQDQEVIVIDTSEDNLRIFGGLITRLSETFYKGQTDMEVDVTCTGWGTYMERRVGHKLYTTFLGGISGILLTSLMTDMNSDVDTGIRSQVHGLAGSVSVGEVEVYAQKVAEAVRRVANMSNADIWVDNHKVLHFFSSTGWEAAPFSIADDDQNFDKLRVERNTTIRANRVYVKNSRALQAMWTDSYAGDEFGGSASGTIFPTTYGLTDKPIIRVNGVKQVVTAIGVWDVPNWTWYYIPNGVGVFQNTATETPLTTGDTISITYPSPLPYVYVTEDATAIATDGLWEAVIEGRDLPGKTEMAVLGDNELARRKENPVEMTMETRRTGLFPGQVIIVNTTQPLLNDTLLIKSVSGNIVDGKFARWTVKATNTSLHRPDTFAKYMAEMVWRTRQPVRWPMYAVVFSLAPTIEGITNAGLSTGVKMAVRAAPQDGVLNKITLWFQSVGAGTPTTADIKIDVLRNGASILDLGSPQTNLVTFEAGETSVVSLYDFVSDPLEVTKDDLFTVNITEADSAATDGVLELHVLSG
jgi:hypothetical protein